MAEQELEKKHCPECGSELERDPVHIFSLRCSNIGCDYWCGLHPPSAKVNVRDLLDKEGG